MSAIGGLFGGDEGQVATLVDVLSHASTRGTNVCTPEGVRQIDPDEAPDTGDAPWVLVSLTDPADAEDAPVLDTEHGYALAVDDEDVLEHHEGDTPTGLGALVEELDARLEGGHLARALQSMGASLDVFPALAAIKAEGAVLVREPSGVCPFYYGRSEDVGAFASERKPLWRMGLEANRVKPNTMVLLHEAGSQTIHLPRGRAGLDLDGDELLDELENATRHAVATRTRHADEVGILATRAGPAALLSHLVADAGKTPVAFVPDAADGARADAIQTALDETPATTHRVPIQPEKMSGRVGELLHAIEERDQQLAADALVPFLVCSRAASEGVPLVLADRGRGDPYVQGALEAAHARASASDDESPLFAEGPLERAHKAARRTGTSLRVPLADPTVRHLLDTASKKLDPKTGPIGALLDRLGQAPAHTPEVEAERDERIQVLREAAHALDLPDVPARYDAVASLRQREHSGPGPGRALLEPGDARGLDDALQWGLDHRAIDAGAIGPDETQRLERYLENVQTVRAG